jgi:hypothetical protein
VLLWPLAAHAEVDLVGVVVKAMLAASDEKGRQSALFAAMGRAKTQEDRRALGQLRLFVEGLEADGLDEATIRQRLQSYAEAATEAERDFLVAEARHLEVTLAPPQPGGGAGSPPPGDTGATASAPPASTSTASPRPPPLAPFVPGSPSTGGDTARVLLARLVAVPDPAAAAVLSASVGFGAGHFYAQQPVRGWGFLAAQVAGAGVLAGGLATAPEGEWSDVATAGVVALVVARGIDTALAPGSAHQTAADAFR